MAYKTLSTKMVYRGGQNLEDMEICHLRGSVGLSQASNAYAILVYPQNMVVVQQYLDIYIYTYI